MRKQDFIRGDRLSVSCILGLMAVSTLATYVVGCGSDDGPSGSTIGTGGAPQTSPISGIGGSMNGTSTSGGAASMTNAATSTNPGSSSPSASDAPVGTFTVVLTPPDQEAGTVAAASLKGIVRTSAQPDPKSWSVSAEEGKCKLLIPAVPNCTPRCSNGEVCVTGGVCQASPVAKSVGIVSVTGVKLGTGASEFSIEPTNSNVYMPDDDLAYPPFDEGSAIRVSAAGGDLEAFSIESVGIAPLVVAAKKVSLQEGQPLTIEWTPKAATATSDIQVDLDISQHAGTKGMVSCSTADTGALEIPAALISALLKLGVAGFPTIAVTRNSASFATIAIGRVKLLQTSGVELPVEVPGLTSCNDDIPCPTGKICQSDYTCK